MNHLKHLLVVLGLSVVGLIALAPAQAFARGGHGGGGLRAAPTFRGGGFHAAPAFRGTGAFRSGPVFHRAAVPYRGVGGPRLVVGPRPYAPGMAFGRTWVPGYWGWNSGVRVWIGGAYMMPPHAGWTWMAAHWSWNGVQWVWQAGYWAAPPY